VDHPLLVYDVLIYVDKIVFPLNVFFIVYILPWASFFLLPGGTVFTAEPKLGYLIYVQYSN
jgi:hypothetical protein